MSLIIDGHNLIGVMPDIDLADPDDEWQLVQRLRSYTAARKTNLTVVFDPGIGPSPNWDLSGGAVTVRFAPHGVKADSVIVQMTQSAGSGRQSTVVTDDRELAGMVRAAGGQVRSATRFAQSLSAKSPAAGTTTEPHLDPRDPAFADIYAGFAAVDKDAVRFGQEVGLEIETWIERLYGSDVQEASRAAHWLGRFGGDAALDPLLDGLTHYSATVRAAALLALADLGDRRAVPEIIPRLTDDKSGLAREAAAQALGRLGGAQAEPALQAALSDPKSKVRKAAAASLEQIQARR